MAITMSLLESTATELLPTGWAKFTLLLTVVITLSPFAFPENIVSEIQMSGQAQLLLLKLTVSLLLALIGSCVTLLIILYHYTRGKGQDEIAARNLKARAEANRQKLIQDSYLHRLGK